MKKNITAKKRKTLKKIKAKIKLIIRNNKKEKLKLAQLNLHRKILLLKVKMLTKKEQLLDKKIRKIK